MILARTKNNDMYTLLTNSEDNFTASTEEQKLIQYQITVSDSF